MWQGRAIGQVVHADPMVESIEPASPGDGVAHGVRVVRHPMAPPSVRRQDALADEVTEPPRGPAGAANRGEECEGLVRGHGRVRTGSKRLPCASLEGVASARIRKDEDPSRDLEVFSEAERRRGPERPDALAVDAGVEGLARIFEEDQPMPPATFLEDLHRVRDAVQVRRQDGSQSGPRGVIDCLRIEVPGVRIDRSQDRHESCGEDGEEDHIVVHRRHQDSVAGRKPFAERDVEGEPPGREDQGIAAVPSAEEFFDCLDVGSQTFIPSGPAPAARRFRIDTPRGNKVLRFDQRTFHGERIVQGHWLNGPSRGMDSRRTTRPGSLRPSPCASWLRSS